MRRVVHRVVLLFCFSTLFLIVFAQEAHRTPAPSVVANEGSARLVLKERSSAFSIDLSANASKPVHATLLAKILAPDDKVLATASVPAQISSTVRRFDVPLNWVPVNGLEDASSSRLFYEVRLEDGSIPALSGILSPYALIPDLFELHFLGLDAIGNGRTYVARVWATRPSSDRPVPGVSLAASFGDEDEDSPKGLKSQARTNSRGEALLTFHLPQMPGAPEDEQVDLEICGTRGNFQNSLSASLHYWRRAGVLLSTDKPLYQPEQTLHMRALLLDDERRAWAKRPLRFTVRDPDDTVIFSTDVETSRFGIASADWIIPSSQKLGSYRVAAGISGEADSRELQGNQLIRISRYELPTFTVNVVANQPFYLPGQNADLAVSAEYMFGKPVLRGHVRIVREARREWSYREQKWETEEGESQDGELDGKNEFHATLNLSKDHSDLQDTDWKRFEDLRYAAYLTDASSKRTQERHFDVRISRDAIHLYMLNGAAGALPVGLRPVFYLSSSLADGTPAAADVLVSLYTQDPSDTSKPLAKPFATAHARTNRYGIARVRFSEPLRKEKDQARDTNVDRIYVALEGKTLDGRTGHHLESYSLQYDPTLRITPLKAILKPGDPIEAELESSVPQSHVRVELIHADTQTILASQEFNLAHASAHVTFSPDKQFTGTIALAAYPLKIDIEPYSMYSRMAATSVVFPNPTNLQLDVKAVKTTYRPGEAASVNLRVRGSEGEPVESALGLLVYDQALEELARTEASLFTSGYERIDPRLGFRSLDEDNDSIAGVSVRQLLNRASDAAVPPDLELLAQALLFNRSGVPLRLESSDSPRYLDQVFQKQIRPVLDPVAKLLQEHFSSTGHFPANDVEYTSFLNEKGVDAYHLDDPWGRPFHARRTYQWVNEVFEFGSEGPDKTLKTSDDFTAMSISRPFFEFDAKRLRSIVDTYHASTGGYIRDQASFEAACAQQHTPLSNFVDPWGTPYRFLFEIVRENYTIKVVSAGPDKRFRSGPNDPTGDWDDLQVSVQNMPYFRETAQSISDALFESAKSSAHFPETEQEFRKAMADHAIDWNALRDPWGRPYRIIPTLEIGYSDKVTLRAYGQNVATSQTPISRTTKGISIVSDGPDLISNTADDFVIAKFASPFLEELGSPTGKLATPQKPQPFYSGKSGAVRIFVQDPTGAAIPNAKITLTNESTGIAYEGRANDQGLCLLSNLPPGTYRVLVESSGFRSYVLTSIPVLSSNVTDVEVTLNVGTAMETVEVSAENVQVQTESSSVAVLAGKLGLTTKSGAASGQINIPLATPRLREYFPETLLWQPEIHTDRAGRSTVRIPLADTITTWKVSVIASTRDGHITTASTDIRAFLPFFAELEPPKVLTVGDEIHLPVTVRNYLDKPQSVSLDWAAEPWSQDLSPRTVQLDVSAGNYAQQTFSFRAAVPMKDAKQRLTAFNRSSANDSDAIEKKLHIHADGQQRLAQSSSIFLGDTALSIEIPASALPGSVEAELVLYPNLIAHVGDAIEGIMGRPYGCAEQTISSAYPSLLWLELQKSQHFPPSPLDARAHHYLKLAYAKLLRYRESGGGFSLWGKGEPEIPVSAYALRFLTEASEFTDADPDVTTAARRWLLQQATPEGAWMEKDSKGKILEISALYDTAYVVEVLARDLQHRNPNDKDIAVEREAVRKAIEYFAKSSHADSDPYAIALIALAKLAAAADASKEITTLLSLEHSEGEASYWDLQRNTIFYGWGTTGRIETTALVLDALTTAKQSGNYQAELDQALNRGTRFLLKNKDQYGVWYSTQATVDVLQTLVRQLGTAAVDSAQAPMRIFVDGKSGPQFSASADSRQLTPQRADLTQFLSPGKHSIQIRGGPSTHASAYLNASYYLPWTDPAITASSVRSGDAESLRYSVTYDRTVVALGEAIGCTVHAERVGFRGYGMMLAEIGLPPGAEVDRSSLEAALSANWDVQSYEIQPDRIVVYLWPRAGGTTFSFSLKARFAMRAQSAESILYDYYNPEARASVPPARFVVQ
jgi:uncharacterized protein YfaS (alpha-2-macroglobulin family)